jgi:deoxyribodipyrimidine photo-lyase
MATHVVLFTRDLRVHDHPALTAAVEDADRVVPLFVFDAAILGSSFAAPNRVAFLLDCLSDLRASLRDRDGDLVLRRGDVAAEVAAIVDEVAADTVHVTGDVSAYARRRERSLADARGSREAEVVVHPGHLVHEPGVVTPAGGDHYKVFTPFWRSWKDTPRRDPLPALDRVDVPSIDPGVMPTLDDLVGGEPSPALPEGGETAARARLDWWLDGPIADYDESRNVLAATDGTSRLSPHLHLGTISAVEILDRLDLRRRGHEGLRRSCAGASSTTNCWPPPPPCPSATTARAATSGGRTTKRSRHGATVRPGTRSWTRACANSATRDGCTTVPA